jgi:hypothetical protein
MTKPPIESYTHTEIDELGGALLYVGGLSHSLGHILDVTAVPDDLGLIEFVNHAPHGMADAILSGLLPVIAEVRARLGAVEEAFTAAIDGQTDQVSESFDALIKALYPEAERDGLS